VWTDLAKYGVEGFPNHFFSDSWAVGFWRTDPDGVAVDVPLGGLNRPVTGEQLDIGPEWEEQPFRPMFLKARLNQATILSGVTTPPRCEPTT
jgi:hypothetical protein